MTSIKEVEITTFINPHLFWYIINNEERFRSLLDMNKILSEVSKNSFKSTNFEVGEIVVVELKKKLFRATIEYICQENSNQDSLYLCWLIDFGTMIETNAVHKMPISLRKTGPLAFQACLNNVVYLEQHLGYDNIGEGIVTSDSVKTPTTKSFKTSREILSKASSFGFIIENEDDGVLYGDVILRDKEGNEESLRNSLIERDILKIDKAIFEEITESLDDYKERNIMLIAQICKQSADSLEKLLNSASCDPTEACARLKLKYCHEFDDDKIVMSEDEFSAISNKNRSRLNESSTSLSESDSPKSLALNVVLSKRKQLLQNYISQRKSLNKSDQDSILSDSVDDTKETGSIKAVNTSNESQTANFKIKRLLESIKAEKEKTATKHTENTKPPKRKIVYYPGGGERSFLEGIRKKNRDSSAHSITSEESPVDKSNCCRQNTSLDEVFQPDLNSTASEPSKSKNVDLSSEPDLLSESQNDASEKHIDMDTGGDDDVSTASTFGNDDKVNTLQIKPYCSCKQCEHWTKEENVWEDGPCTLKKVSKIDQTSQQKLFKDPQCAEGNTSIISLDYDTMTKIEKQASLKLLVHSGSIPTPVKLLSKLPFHKEVHRSLEQLDYKVAKLIQAYAWPALFRNQNLCMIHGPKTGKTMAYLPVICTFVLEKVDRYESLLNVSGGPIAIILCSDSRKCEDVYDLAKVLTRRNWTKIQLLTYPIGHVNSSHIDIVVTTPPVLLETLKSKSVNFKRLCHLILEDGDKILDRHRDEMGSFFELAQSVLHNRVFSKSVQLIVCAEHWDGRLANLLRSLEQTPTVCIGNYLEAALYGKMEFSMKFSNSACKEGELRALLKDTYRIHKSVVVCKESEVEDVEIILRLKGIDSTIVSDGMSTEEVSLREDMWALAKGGSYTVLVCTDFLLNSILTVTSANLLIHYSLPSSWTKFVQRFRCLLENCKSPLDNSEAKIPSRSVILIDETAEAQMNKFFSYIYSTELKHQLPEKLQIYAQGLVKMGEDEKLARATPLCDNLKLFGKCGCPHSCRQRHTLSPSLDVSDTLPRSGTIKFKIRFVQHVTLFSVKLLQHVDADGGIDEFDDLADPSDDLTACLRISRKKLKNPVVGHVYALHDDEGYRRAELVGLEGGRVRVKLIDRGDVVEVSATRLYQLPSEFGEAGKPRAVVDAYLANYVPPFGDERFCSRSLHHLRTMLEKVDYRDVIFSGEVHLQLGRAVWLKNVCQQVELSDRVIPGWQMSREVLRKKLVEYSNDQLFGLYESCARAGIEVERRERKPQAKAAKKVERAAWQWAHLDVEKVNEVTFSAAVSPDEVYVRLNKFGDLLYALQKDIQQSLSKPNYPRVQSVSAGDVYLAKDPDGLEYCRVLVLETDERRALCFYVDFGDEAVVGKDELRHLLDCHVARLPFQSVQCRLHGVRAIEGEWADHVRDTLYEYANEPDTDIFRTLYLKVCRKEAAGHSGQKRYSVLMKDGFGERNPLINTLLVDCGWAVTDSEDLLEDFEIPPANCDSYESNDDIDEAIDICKKTDELEEHFVTDEHFYDPEDLELFLQDESDPMDFFKQIMNFRNNEPTTMRNRELPPITAVPAGDCYTPEIYWSQTETIVRINIKLTDVEDYKLTLTKGRILNFRTVKDDKTYSLKVMLYETAHSVQHTSPGPDVRVTLVKAKPIEWPRLALSKQRTRNVHYDLSTVAVEEEGRRRFLQLPVELDLSDGDDDDDEEDIMYHVTSDMDSDMDFELEHESD